MVRLLKATDPLFAWQDLFCVFAVPFDVDPPQFFQSPDLAFGSHLGFLPGSLTSPTGAGSVLISFSRSNSSVLVSSEFLDAFARKLVLNVKRSPPLLQVKLLQCPPWRVQSGSPTPLDSCPASEIHSCAGAFFNVDIAIDGEVSEALDQTAGRGPLYFQPVDLHMRTNSQDQPWVVRR